MSEPEKLEGIELGIAVAEHVMGWAVIEQGPDYRAPKTLPFVVITHNRGNLYLFKAENNSELWEPWHDVSDAWEVLRVLMTHGSYESCGKFFRCLQNNCLWQMAEAEAATRICRLALKAVGQ